MKIRGSRILLYAVLTVIGAFFLFPFYWVVISSLKTPAGMTMRPPSFYPSEPLLAEYTVELAKRLVKWDGHEWLILCDAKGGGVFGLQFDDGRASKLVRRLEHGLFEHVEGVAGKVTLRGLPVVRIAGWRANAVVLARMSRQHGGRSEERLFVAGGGAAIRSLVNPDYREVRRFRARWRNYPETLEGPEATFGSDTGSGFLLFMRNSLFISVFAVLGQVLSSSLVAFGFSRLHFKGRDFLFVLLLATLMVPGQVTLIPLFGVYKRLGWIDTFLPLIVPHFTAGAFNVFLLRQYMLTLPKELDESAAMDGCGPFQTYSRIIMPNCVPVLIVVALFTFVYTWQAVMGPLIYLDNPEYRTVTLGLEYFRSPYVDNRHLIMTGAVLAMLPVAGVFLVLQRYIMAGIATTGLKA